MNDAQWAHRNDPAWLHVLRHMAGLGGWVFDDYFDHSERMWPVRDELLKAGHIALGEHNNGPAYLLTDAGRAELAKREES